MPSYSAHSEPVGRLRPCYARGDRTRQALTDMSTLLPDDATMETDLTRELQRYYRWGRGGLVFTNGMSLNQLAWAVRALPGGHALDASFLSRIFRGSRTFASEQQLSAICDVLALRESQRRRLFILLAEDRARRHLVEVSTLRAADLLEWSQLHLHNIVRCYTEGNPLLAKDMASQLSGQIYDQLPRTSNSSALASLVSTLAQLHYQQAIFTWDSTSTEKIAAEAWSIVDDLDKLWREYKIDTARHLASLCTGYINYTTGGNPATSIHFLKQGISHLKGRAYADHQAEALRTLAICFAQLGENSRFEAAEEHCHSYIDSGHWTNAERICEVYEGLARGRGLLRLDSAFELLDEAEGTYRLLESGRARAPLRRVQLSRTRLVLIKQLQPNDLRTLEQIGYEGIRLAEEYAFPRHQVLIEELLQSGLN